MSGNPPLHHEDIQRIRRSHGRSMLLFLTDRCPVGCLHCSVDSRRDSPTITDFALFGDILEWMCGRSGMDVVGISGGEPFVERRGLELSSQRLYEAGKRLVIFTSGVWAKGATTAPWIREVLGRTATVYLSTDSFHARTVSEGCFANAAAAIAEAGCWIVVQVLDNGSDVAEAASRLASALGEQWREHAEINVITPLLHGRGASQFTRRAVVPGHSFAPCNFVTSPLIRYDGLAVACCNESMIRGKGPQRLRRQIGSAAELSEAVATFQSDPLIKVIEGIGPGALTSDPRFADLADRPFSSACHLCWKIFERLPDAPSPDPMIEAMATLVPAR